jgi:hypothetical protein
MHGALDELPKRRQRGPSWDRALIEQARDRRRLGDTIKEIHQGLPADVPESTIKSWVADVRPDPSGEWRLWDRLPEADPTTVIPLLATTSWATDGRVTSFTKAQAQWVTLLARVAPRLRPADIYPLARAFIEALEADNTTELRRLQALVGEVEARNRWPTLADETAALVAKAKRLIAARKAGANPFLDGRPYQTENEK